MTTRREFLTAQPLRDAVEQALDDSAAGACVPLAGNTVRLGKAAMASDFEVILNPDSRGLLSTASDALALIDQLEDQLSVYRPHSELSRLNARGGLEPVVAERQLFELLRQSVGYAAELEGAFDPTSGPLVALWRICRRERRLPTDAELDEARTRIGCDAVEFDNELRTIHFRRSGIALNLNAIGKGYALDRAGEILASGGREPPEPVTSAELPTDSIAPVEKVDSQVRRNPDAEMQATLQEACALRSPGATRAWLIHGGHSSILARGSLAGSDGWAIALRHPLFPNRQLATLLLKDRGMSTSGSGVQFYRVGEKRYGHLLDPRTGWPVEGMLSVTVLAPTAARAEALSTAFFVLGVEKARAYCHNHPEISALLIPAPRDGQRLEPVVCGIPETDLIWTPDPASGPGSTYQP